MGERFGFDEIPMGTLKNLTTFGRLNRTKEL